MTPEERFWTNVHITDDGCWEWQRSRHSSGHGRVYWRGRVAYAHRVAWESVNGEIPAGMNVCHHCDNPPCVNPEHLFLGSQRDNVRDCMAKGRDNRGKAIGEINARAKISLQDALEIRDLYGSVPVKELADRYGVSQGHIWRIATGRNCQAAMNLLTKGAAS